MRDLTLDRDAFSSLRNSAGVLALLLASGLVFSPTARATDGVAEINQTCVVQSGCFAGDAPGFPLTITTTGSYRLTGNLDSSGSSGTSIEVTADDVFLDLNGFTISTAERVTLLSSANLGTTLSNGTLKRQAPGVGLNPMIVLGDRATLSHVEASGTNFAIGSMIQLGSHCRVFNSTVYSIEGGAISSGASCIFSDNVVRAGDQSSCGIGSGNESVIRSNSIVSIESGICTGNASLIDGNHIRGQMQGAVFAGAGSTITENVVSFSNMGISCGDGCTIRGNAARGLNLYGIKCGSGCTITQNAVNQTGPTAGSAGIECGGACTVLDNVSNGSSGFGLLDTVGGTAYRGNQFNNNNGGNANPQVSGGIEIGTNLCGGNTSCP